jgi:hypothetical protein
MPMGSNRPRPRPSFEKRCDGSIGVGNIVTCTRQRQGFDLSRNAHEHRIGPRDAQSVTDHSTVSTKRLAETEGSQRFVAARRRALRRVSGRTWKTCAARKRPRNDYEVANAKASHFCAACHHLRHAFVTVGKGSGEWIGRRAAKGLVQYMHHGTDAKKLLKIMPKIEGVSVASGGDERAHDRVRFRRQGGLGNIPPLQDLGLEERELAHGITP